MLVEQILSAIKQPESYIEVYSDQTCVGKHEMVFFLKPEVLSVSPKINIEKIVSLAIEKLKNFKFQISNVKVIKAEYLKVHNTMAQHYGVIGQIATDAQCTSDKAKEKFATIFSKKFSEATVLGGLEFLKKYTQFNTFTLDVLWQNNKIEKLAGGTYVQEVKIDDEIIYLMNGFFPRYVEHFTASGRYLILFTVLTDLSWKEARQNFIGTTDPEQANKGSLRRDFFENATSLGLDVVNRSTNGAHLSAGPIEALVELKRFNTDKNKGVVKNNVDFTFGKQLEELFTESQINKILENRNIVVDGSEISSFDLSEEIDASDVISILQKSNL